MTAVVTVANAGNVTAVLMIFLAPGYALVSALFPRKSQIGWIERVLLSAGSSLAVVSLIGVVLGLSMLGIRILPLTLAVSITTLGLNAIAYRIRTKVPLPDRLAYGLSLKWPDLHAQDWRSKVSIALMIAILLTSSGILVYAFSVESPAERFTEFYILGLGENGDSYPTHLGPGQVGTVSLVIENHEGATVRYEVRIDLLNVTSDLEKIGIGWFNTTLEDSARWTQLYNFTIDVKGIWKVQFVLLPFGQKMSQLQPLLLPVQVA